MKQETIDRGIEVITLSIDRETKDLLTKMMADENRNRSNMIVIAIKEAYQRRHELVTTDLES